MLPGKPKMKIQTDQISKMVAIAIIITKANYINFSIYNDKCSISIQHYNVTINCHDFNS